MLKELCIKDFALIDYSKINFLKALIFLLVKLVQENQ